MNSRCQCRLSGPVDTILGCHRDPISSEKSWLDYAVRELSREAAGKARGQEAVWKEAPDWFKAVCPYKWKNPTANPKDSKEVLKCKFECLVKRLRELDQVPEEMMEEIELWESGKVAELFLLTSFCSALGHTSSVHSILSDAQRRMQDKRSGISSVILDHLERCLTACLDTVNALKGMSSRQGRESSSQKHSDCRQNIPESSAQKNISLSASSTQKEINSPPDPSELPKIRSNHKRKMDESYSDDSAQASSNSKSKKRCRASVSSFSPSSASPSTCSPPSLPSPSSSTISSSSSFISPSSSSISFSPVIPSSSISPSSSSISASSSTVSLSSSSISPSSSTISPSSLSVSISSSSISPTSSAVFPTPPHNNSLNPEQAQLVLALFQQQTYSVTPEVSNIPKVSSAPISSTQTHAGLNKTAIKPAIAQPSADQTLPTQHFITASSDLSKEDNFPDFLELDLDLEEVDELEGVDDSKSFDSMLSNFPLVDSHVSNLAFMSADTHVCGLENIPSADPFLHEDSPLSKIASCEASPYSEKSSEAEGRERLGSGTSPHSSVRGDAFIDLGYSSETSTSHRSSVDSDYDLCTPDALEALVL